MRVIVAGFGNVLRADDGFGIAVVHKLHAAGVPAGVEVLDVNIGGIHLVQALLAEPADGLVVVDALDLGRAPGTVVVLEPDVLDVTALGVLERRDHLADMHYANPERALMLVAAMGVLPARTIMVGCQPEDADAVGQGLSDAVTRGVARALVEVRAVVTGMGIEWLNPGGR
ncbi:MAG: hydrogenase maturation protease [Euzebyales bacterium]|nr:hydrogenase maturation protease [Euzebyales bacterium]